MGIQLDHAMWGVCYTKQAVTKVSTNLMEVVRILANTMEEKMRLTAVAELIAFVRTPI